MENTIVVTRHEALIEYLLEIGLITKDTPVISHANPEEIKGKDVIGVLPLSLAVLTNTITEVPLKLTPEDRGRELSLERLKEISDSPRTYTVNPLI